MKKSSGRNRVEEQDRDGKKERGDVENNIFDLRQADRRYFHFGITHIRCILCIC